jgi:hypothetical protein
MHFTGVLGAFEWRFGGFEALGRGFDWRLK